MYPPAGLRCALPPSVPWLPPLLPASCAPLPPCEPALLLPRPVVSLPKDCQDARPRHSTLTAHVALQRPPAECERVLSHSICEYPTR